MRKNRYQRKKLNDKIRSVDVEDNYESDDYVFTVSEVSCTSSNQEDISVNIGGVTVLVIVDSGASVNVIDRELCKK